MRILLLLLSFIIFGTYGYGQQKVDLSKAPVGTNGVNNSKSNAAILREATPLTTKNDEVNLSEKYKANNTTQGTFKAVKQNEIQPGTLNSGPEVLNGNTQQINLGTGTKANSTTYYDNEGRIRGTNTTIKFGK